MEKPSKDAYKARAPEDESEPMPAAIAQSATVRARTGSLKGAVSILTGSPPVPPGQRSDELIAALYKTEQRSEEDEELFRGELDAIQKSSCTSRVRLSPKQASAQVRRIRPAAGAGPSGWRNSHIQVLHSDADGPASLIAWANAWANGTFHPKLVQLWTPALARPFGKNSRQEAVRPIVCGEALLKFAVGTVVHSVQPVIERGVGERQFGAGRACGASREVAEVRAAAAICPDDVHMTLDVNNAFGEVAWHHASNATRRRVPQLAAIMAIAWSPGEAVVFTQSGCGKAGTPCRCLGVSCKVTSMLTLPSVACMLMSFVMYSTTRPWQHSWIRQRIGCMWTTGCSSAHAMALQLWWTR